MQTIEEEPTLTQDPFPEDSDLLIDLDHEPIGEKKRPLFRRPAVVIGTAVFAVLAIIYSATIFLHSLTDESTDDAFIDAHIITVAPKIAGKIVAVDVSDNTIPLVFFFRKVRRAKAPAGMH